MSEYLGLMRGTRGHSIFIERGRPHPSRRATAVKVRFPHIVAALCLLSVLPWAQPLSASVEFQSVRTLESYGGEAADCRVATSIQIDSNLRAIHKWLDDIFAAGQASSPALSLNGKSFCVGNNPVSFPHNNLNIKGGAAVRSEASRNGTLESTASSGSSFVFTGYAPLLEGVVLSGAGRGSGLSVVAEFNAPTDTRADLDARLIESCIIGGDTLVKVRGRGFEMTGGYLVDGNTGVDIGMPNNFQRPVDFQSTREGGSRVYRFNGVRFHSVIGAGVANTDPIYGPFLFGIQIENCYLDSFARLFDGYLNHSIISGNIHFTGNSQSIRLSGAKNSLIVNNLFSGATILPSDFDAVYSSSGIDKPQYLMYGVQIKGETENLRIAGNRFAYINNAPIFVSDGTTHRNLEVDSNGFYHTMLQNDSRTDPIMAVASGATIAGLNFRNNTALLSELSKMGGAAWLSGPGSITNLSYADNFDGGKLSFRRIAITGALSYRASYAPVKALTVYVHDADTTLVPNVGDFAETIKVTSGFTANRTFTLSKTGAYPGMKWRVARTASISRYTLSIGGLVFLGPKSWTVVEYDGSEWFVSAYGLLP